MLKFIFSHTLSLFLLFLLIVSGLLNVRLFKERIDIYRQLNNLSLDPVKINYFSKSNPQEEETSGKKELPKVVFFGDSRAAAWSNPNLETFEFINRGIGGQTSAQTLLRFDAHVRDLSPDIIVLQVGGNDLRMVPHPRKTRDDIIEDCKNNIKNIITKAQSIKAKIIVTTIFPLAKGNIPSEFKWIWPETDEIDRGIEEVNDYIRTLEQQPNVVVFDAYKILEKQGKVQDIYAKDLLHLNDRGYEKLNQDLSKYF